MWAIAILVGLVALGAGGVRYALGQNPHRVLDTVDAVTGSAKDVALLHRAATGTHAGQKLLVYGTGKAGAPLPVFVFFHGGSWAHGDPEHYGFIARNMAPEGFIVVLGGYRLGEAGRYPAMLEDTAAAIGWTYRNVAQFGGDPQRIHLGGHSAGAYNVVQVALEQRWLAAEGVPQGAIDGVVGLAGPYDFFPFDSDSTKAAFGAAGAGEGSQPVNHARGDAPPMLLVHGEADTLVRPRNTRALAAALAREGARVEVEYLPEGDHNAPLLGLANPWRRDPRVHDRVTNFLTRGEAQRDKVSVPVQDGTS